LYSLFGEREVKIKFGEQKNINFWEFPEFSKQISKEKWKNINESIQQYSIKIEETNNNGNERVSDILNKIKTNGCKLTDFEIKQHKDDDLYKMILNDCFFIWEGITLDNVRSDKRNQGDLITKKVKSYFNELSNNYWEDSDDRKYFTSLRENIAKSTPFELNATESIVELSIAAFLLKGDNLNDLHKYIVEKNGIGNLSYAYGLWGAASGFANMPKTLTNSLFLSRDLTYISEIYKYIYKQLHGIELDGMLGKKIVEKIKGPDYTTTNLSKMNEKTQEHKEVEESKDDDYENLFSELSKRFTSITPHKKSYIDGFKTYITRGGTLEELKIKNNTLTKIKKLIGMDVRTLDLLPNQQIPIQQNKIKEPKTQKESSKNLLTDFDFLSNNDEFIKIVSKHKNWKEDLEWFIKEYNNPDSAYYKGNKSKDNRIVIQKYLSLKNEKYKETEELLKSLYLHHE
jgi:hypothetical protein